MGEFKALKFARNMGTKISINKIPNVSIIILREMSSNRGKAILRRMNKIRMLYITLIFTFYLWNFPIMYGITDTIIMRRSGISTAGFNSRTSKQEA